MIGYNQYKRVRLKNNYNLILFQPDLYLRNVNNNKKSKNAIELKTEKLIKRIV